MSRFKCDLLRLTFGHVRLMRGFSITEENTFPGSLRLSTRIFRLTRGSLLFELKGVIAAICDFFRLHFFRKRAQTCFSCFQVGRFFNSQKQFLAEKPKWYLLDLKRFLLSKNIKKSRRNPSEIDFFFKTSL